MNPSSDMDMWRTVADIEGSFGIAEPHSDSTLTNTSNETGLDRHGLAVAVESALAVIPEPVVSSGPP